MSIFVQLAVAPSCTQNDGNSNAPTNPKLRRGGRTSPVASRQPPRQVAGPPARGTQPPQAAQGVAGLPEALSLGGAPRKRSAAARPRLCQQGADAPMLTAPRPRAVTRSVSQRL